MFHLCVIVVKTVREYIWRSLADLNPVVIFSASPKVRRKCDTGSGHESERCSGECFSLVMYILKLDSVQM